MKKITLTLEFTQEEIDTLAINKGKILKNTKETNEDFLKEYLKSVLVEDISAVEIMAKKIEHDATISSDTATIVEATRSKISVS